MAWNAIALTWRAMKALRSAGIVAQSASQRLHALSVCTLDTCEVAEVEPREVVTAIEGQTPVTNPKTPRRIWESYNLQQNSSLYWARIGIAKPRS
jgi:hypothetical protein